MLALGIVRLGYERRAIFFFTGLEIIPYALVLNHVRVRVDHVRFYVCR